jgi:hypothetical protein
MIRLGTIPKDLATYKMQIAFLFKHQIGGISPNINSEKEIDQYCKKVLKVLDDDKLAQKQLELTIEVFRKKMTDWIKLKGESYKFGIKSSVEFSRFLMQSANEQRGINENLKNRGKVLTIGHDRNGLNYGFISKEPEDIFFHSADNPSLSFKGLHDRDVLYNIVINPLTGKEKAINVTLLS